MSHLSAVVKAGRMRATSGRVRRADAAVSALPHRAPCAAELSPAGSALVAVSLTDSAMQRMKARQAGGARNSLLSTWVFGCPDDPTEVRACPCLVGSCLRLFMRLPGSLPPGLVPRLVLPGLLPLFADCSVIRC